MQKVLVTGCAGLVGHGICSHLLRHGYQVIGTSRNAVKAKISNFSMVSLDLTSIDSIRLLSNIVDEVDAVVHNAAQIPEDAARTSSPEEGYFKVNTQGTFEMLRLVANSGNKPFVHISSSPGSMVVPNGFNDEADALYNPANAYYASKIAAEIFCKQFQSEKRLDTTVLRINAPYGYRGPRNAVIPRFIDMARRGEDITLWGTGQRQQMFTFVEDIGLACRLALESKLTGIFNITSDEIVTMQQLASKIVEIFQSDSEVVFNGQPDPQEGRQIKVSIEKARKVLGYVPEHNLVNGLLKIKQFFDAGYGNNFNFL